MFCYKLAKSCLGIGPLPYDLDRFVVAQKNTYQNALIEMKNGEKMTHWIWYTLPQLYGLGLTEKTKKYAIKSIDEAKIYLKIRSLRNNYYNIVNEIYTQICINKVNPVDLMGSIVDTQKLYSSLTLFHHVSTNPRFKENAMNIMKKITENETLKSCEDFNKKHLLKFTK